MVARIGKEEGMKRLQRSKNVGRSSTLIILILYTCVKIYQIVYLKYIWFTAYPFNLDKHVFKKKKKIKSMGRKIECL